MPTWPATVTQGPLVGTLEITSEPNVSEFKPDVFSNMIRSRRYTAKAYTYNAVILLYTTAQKIAMDDFFSVDCVDGVLPFDMNDWEDQLPASFQWIQPPAFSHVAMGIWRMSVNLLKLPGST